jgi:hypothetical protein
MYAPFRNPEAHYEQILYFLDKNYEAFLSFKSAKM